MLRTSPGASPVAAWRLLLGAGAATFQFLDVSDSDSSVFGHFRFGHFSSRCLVLDISVSGVRFQTFQFWGSVLDISVLGSVLGIVILGFSFGHFRLGVQF